MFLNILLTQVKLQVKYEHLDHEPFSYSIAVNNTSGAEKKTTVRIFLAPKYDELGNRLILEDQRRLFIELDKFTRTREFFSFTLNNARCMIELFQVEI